MKVKNESVCLYILKNFDIQYKDEFNYFKNDDEHWLINAIEMNSPELVRMLLDIMEKSQLIEHFFDPTDYIQIGRYDKRRRIVPDYYLRAAKQNNTEIVKILIEHKVPINYDSEDFFKNALF